MGAGAIRVLVFEHNPALLDGLTALLAREQDISFVCASTAAEALERYRQIMPEVTVLDVAGAGSLELVQHIRKLHPRAPIIPLVGYEPHEKWQAVAGAIGTMLLPIEQISNCLLPLIRGLQARNTYP